MGERDARMREAEEIRTDVVKTFADNRKVQGENHTQLESLIELERQAVHDLLETERTSRIRELQDLKFTLSRQFNDAHNVEKTARETQLEELLRVVGADKTEATQKVNRIDVMYTELQTLHDKLASSHAQLQSAHTGLVNSHSTVRQSCDAQRADLNSFIEMERNARTSNLAALEDTLRAEVAKAHNIIQDLEVSVNEDRARTMEQHTQIRSYADTTCNQFKQCIEECLEAKLGALEPQLSENLRILREEVLSRLAAAKTEWNSFQELLHAAQNELNEVGARAQAAAHELSKIITDESVQRSTNIQELQDQMSGISQAVMKLSNVKAEITCEYKAFVGAFYESFAQRDEAASIASAQQMDSISEIVKNVSEKSLDDLHARIEEMRTCFVSERGLHLKWMEEERTAFKKSHDEHMRCVEVERDARLRQATELRTEFVKLITKEREDRIIDASVRRSDAAKRQALKSTVGSSLIGNVHGNTYGSGLFSAGLGTPAVGNSEAGMVPPTTTAGATLDTLLRSTKAK